jgi:uncharacterized membrane protein
MDPNDLGSLQQELTDLRARVLRLESALQQRGITIDQGDPRTAPPTAPPPSPVAGPVPPPPPLTSSAPWTHSETPTVTLGTAPEVPIHVPRSTVRPVEDHSLESRIGSQWFNRIGILAVLIASAWGLKLAFDNHWIGPLGRVIIGLVAGAALIAWSERFRTHGYARFSYSLKAIGTGVLYLSLWAAFSLYHLIASPIAFGAMIVVTAFIGFLAWIQDAELLALYAIVGGLSTPVLLSTGENHEVALFAYLLLLNLAVLVLVALRPWSRLLSGAFLGTVLYVALWAGDFYENGEFATTAFFVSCFFLIFAFAPRLVRLRGDERASAWDSLAVIVVPIANAALGFLAFYLMLEHAENSAPEPWIAVAFAGFYLLLLRLPQRGILREASGTLAALHLTVAIVFLTIAIPLKAHGRWLTIGWLVEGGALTWVARRISSRLLRALAVLCVILGTVALVSMNPAASTTPIFNERFGTCMVAIAVCAFITWLALKAPADAQDQFAVLAWPTIAIAAALTVNGLILFAVGWEIHSYWWYLQYRGDWNLVHDYRMYAQFTYSAFFMLFGAVLLGLGFWRRTAFLRWQALVLLAVAIGKVFTVDVGALSQVYRILSFFGLGVLLLAVSFIYQRDWLNLRKTESAS